MGREFPLLGFTVVLPIGSGTFVVMLLLPSLIKAFDVSTTQSDRPVNIHVIGYVLIGLMSGLISD